MTVSCRLRLAAAPLFALALALAALALAPTRTAIAQGINQAVVVVRTGDGPADARCVSFAEPTISGLDLLARASFTPVSSPQALGQAVCAIDDVGCPATDCFCDCRGADCAYWSYWHWDEDKWRYAGLGASAYDVAPGGIDGWSWGPGSVTDAVPPPTVDLTSVCASAAVPAADPGGDAAAAGTIPGAAPRYFLFAGLVVVMAGLMAWRRRSD